MIKSPEKLKKLGTKVADQKGSVPLAILDETIEIHEKLDTTNEAVNSVLEAIESLPEPIEPTDYDDSLLLAKLDALTEELKKKDFFDEETFNDVVSTVEARIVLPPAVKGDPGYTPVKGKDYFDGEPGYTPVKNIDYFDGSPDTGEQIITKINESDLFIDSARIKGIETFISKETLDRNISVLNQQTSFLINKINNLPSSTSSGTVNHDTTLTGLGTLVSPLGVNVNHAFDWTAQHTFAVPIGVNGVPNPSLTPTAGLALVGDVEFRQRSNPSQPLGRIAIVDTDNYVFGRENFSTSMANSFYNIAVGSLAMNAMDGGVSNIALGYFALGGAVGGVSLSIAIGDSTLGLLTNGSSDIAIGYSALSNLTTGDDNVAIGSGAMGSATTGSLNMAIGAAALGQITNASNNVGIGSLAGYSLTTGEQNVAIGYQSMYGYGTSVTTSGGSIAIGYQALLNGGSNGNNIGIGSGTLSAMQTAGNNIAIGGNAGFSQTTNDYNIIIGAGAMFTNLSGGSNVAIGLNAGMRLTSSNNFILGVNSATNLSTGASNFLLGNGIEFPSNTTSNQLNIANAIFGTGMNGTGTTLATGNIGFFVTTPTARFQLPAGTATASTGPFKFTLPGVILTTPEAGVLETDASRLFYTETSLARKTLVGALFTQTADKTVTNTTTETSIIGTGFGYGLALPTNFWVVGKTIRIKIRGVYSTPIGVASVVVKLKYGSTVIATVTTTSLLSNASGLQFDGEAEITCRSVGSSGSVVVAGSLTYATGIAGQNAIDPLNNGGAATTINTTTANLLDATITWDSATSSRIVKTTITLVEVIN